MKTIRSIKETLLRVTLVTTVLLLNSCSTNQKPEDTKAAAEEHNEAKFDDNKRKKDAQFLVDAAELNLEGVHLGQLAQQKGKAAHVRELGKMMEDAHTKSQKDLTALAQKKTVTIPNSPTDDAKDAYAELNEKSGNDFDKAYANMMVSKHKDAVESFEKASTDCTDSEIKNWATATLPELRKHLDHSIDCQKKCNEMYFEKSN